MMFNSPVLQKYSGKEVLLYLENLPLATHECGYIMLEHISISPEGIQNLWMCIMKEGGRWIARGGLVAWLTSLSSVLGFFLPSPPFSLSLH
jgi:hypothetical protein